MLVSNNVYFRSKVFYDWRRYNFHFNPKWMTVKNRLGMEPRTYQFFKTPFTRHIFVWSHVPRYYAGCALTCDWKIFGVQGGGFCFFKLFLCCHLRWKWSLSPFILIVCCEFRVLCWYIWHNSILSFLAMLEVGSWSETLKRTCI